MPGFASRNPAYDFVSVVESAFFLAVVFFFVDFFLAVAVGFFASAVLASAPGALPAGTADMPAPVPPGCLPAVVSLAAGIWPAGAAEPLVTTPAPELVEAPPPVLPVLALDCAKAAPP